MYLTIQVKAERTGEKSPRWWEGGNENSNLTDWAKHVIRLQLELDQSYNTPQVTWRGVLALIIIVITNCLKFTFVPKVS